MAEKNKYRQVRESLGLSREDASGLLGGISPEGIERIENEKKIPTPEEVMIMAEQYPAPELCNYYCVNQCAIGKEHVTEIKIQDVSQIVLEILNSLNLINREKDRMIQIAVDGVVSDDEQADFQRIQDQLNEISDTVDSLNLWVERMKKQRK